MSRFFRSGGNDSSSDSSSEEEDIYSDEEQQIQDNVEQDSDDDSAFPSDDSDDDSSDSDAAKGASRFLVDASSDEDSSDDEDRAKARSAEAKRADELDGAIKQIENGQKNGDWTLISNGQCAPLWDGMLSSGMSPWRRKFTPHGRVIEKRRDSLHAALPPRNDA